MKSAYILPEPPAEVARIVALGIEWTAGYLWDDGRAHLHGVKIGDQWVVWEVLAQPVIDAIEHELNVPEAEEC